MLVDALDVMMHGLNGLEFPIVNIFFTIYVQKWVSFLFFSFFYLMNHKMLNSCICSKTKSQSKNTQYLDGSPHAVRDGLLKSLRVRWQLCIWINLERTIPKMNRKMFNSCICSKRKSQSKNTLEVSSLNWTNIYMSIQGWKSKLR